MDPADLNAVVLVAGLVLLAAAAAVRVASRAGLPSLLLYLAIGVAIGEAGLGLQFEDAELTQLIGNLALAVILAEGGLSTDWSSVRPVAPMAAVLATVGVFASVAVTTGAVFWLLDVDLRTAIVLGAVASSTDAAAVFSVLRSMPLRTRLRGLVEAESGFNDPPVIILVTVVTSDAWGSSSPWSLVGQIGYQLVVGVLVGGAVGYLGARTLARAALPSSGLYPLAVLALCFVAYATSGLIAGSALMAIYVAGLVLGNTHLPHRTTTEGVAESLAWLAQIGLFVLLGLLASPARLLDALPTALLVGAALTLVARPISVALCLTPFRVPWRDQVFVSWAGLRGAVPIVLATIPMSLGLPGATRIFDVVFLLVVIFTLVQGPTLPWVARRTGAVRPGQSRSLRVESSPLDDVDAVLLQVSIPEGSRLAGVEVRELRLPPGSGVSLVLREGQVFVPDLSTGLRVGDHALVVTDRRLVDQVQRRIRAVGEHGRLAGWVDHLGEERAPRRPGDERSG
ncbi:potassium/proton antiporter [Nocardioides ginkgobilobae]